jgi:MoxR-like ATPase
MLENKRKTEDLLREAYLLQACLTQGTAAGVLEKLLPKRYKQYQKGISGKI